MTARWCSRYRIEAEKHDVARFVDRLVEQQARFARRMNALRHSTARAASPRRLVRSGRRRKGTRAGHPADRAAGRIPAAAVVVASYGLAIDQVRRSGARDDCEAAGPAARITRRIGAETDFDEFSARQRPIIRIPAPVS
jgi:hypothetical protein